MLFDLDEDLLAARQIRSLAEQGNIDAQFALGCRYDRGMGVLQDFVRAHMWLSVSAAAESGRNKESSRKKRITLKYLDGLALQMTAAQIEKAQEMARRCQDTKFKECD